MPSIRPKIMPSENIPSENTIIIFAHNDANFNNVVYFLTDFLVLSSQI
jgi:hypothetical protein